MELLNRQLEPTPSEIILSRWETDPEPDPGGGSVEVGCEDCGGGGLITEVIAGRTTAGLSRNLTPSRLGTMTITSPAPTITGGTPTNTHTTGTDNLSAKDGILAALLAPLDATRRGQVLMIPSATETSGGVNWVLLFILAAAGAGLYYFYRKNKGKGATAND